MNRTTLIVLRDIGDMYDMNICSYASVFPFCLCLSLVPGAVVSSSGKRRRVWEGGSSRPCHTPLSPIEWPSDHMLSRQISVASLWRVVPRLYQGNSSDLTFCHQVSVACLSRIAPRFYQAWTKVVPRQFLRHYSLSSSFSGTSLKDCTKVVPRQLLRHLHSVIELQRHISEGLYQGCTKVVQRKALKPCTLLPNFGG